MAIERVFQKRNEIFRSLAKIYSFLGILYTNESRLNKRERKNVTEYLEAEKEAEDGPLLKKTFEDDKYQDKHDEDGYSGCGSVSRAAV